MSDGIDKTKLLETIAEQGEMIEELRDTLNELVSRRVPIAIALSNARAMSACDDGSMWTVVIGMDEWDRLPDIPQPEEAQESN